MPAVAGLDVQHDSVHERGHVTSPQNVSTSVDCHATQKINTEIAKRPAGDSPAGRRRRTTFEERERQTVRRHDVDDLAAALRAELDRARGQREQRVVPAAADQVARVELGATLADQDLAGADDLAAEALDAEPLSVGVAAVARAGRTLFVCHVGAYFPFVMPVTLTWVSGWR